MKINTIYSSRIKKFLYLCTFLLFIYSCSDQSINSTNNNNNLEEVIQDENVTLNPSGYAPLSAEIRLTTNSPVSLKLKVSGKSEKSPDVKHKFNDVSTYHTLPVLGLYADHDNKVTLTFFDSEGSELGSREYQIQTDSLISDLPEVDIETAQTAKMANGMTLVSYYGHGTNSEVTPQRPFIFDRSGAIRWYLDYSSSSRIPNLFYDDGMERLQNGNLYFGDASTDHIYEINMLGKIVHSWSMPGYSFHHQVYEKPNGNFLLSANKDGADTIEDHILEIDRNTGQIINVWDLRQSLDYDRTTWTDGEKREDWVHVNAVTYDPRDNTILISGCTQGVVKLTENNKVVWIMGPHKGWGESGRGVDLNQFLLQPLDAQGNPITDQSVLDGDSRHPDFEWNWYQHAIKLKPNGHYTLFDNGDNRNYKYTGPYSRAVEYEIDKENMTIKQVWAYGKNRGAETYSRIVSDMDYLPESDHVIFSPGAIVYNDEQFGKSIEVDYSTKQVIFEATVYPPKAAWDIITFHRTERMTLYP